VTVIDVCNARKTDVLLESITASLAKDERGVLGNFNQKSYPINPISYLSSHGITSVFRFIATHPDMDHLDGIKLFFDTFKPVNFWDTDNQETKDFKQEARFSEDDWLFYKKLRDTNPQTNPKRLVLHSGAHAQFYNKGEDGSDGGDGLYLLAPTSELACDARETGEYNDCSYVLLYKTCNHRIIFGGDSHDKTWEHIVLPPAKTRHLH
jgi:beta-lactamase superfamily II metal-dependent hydrolase